MTTAKRKSISKKVRFEVFKRDSFKCQYCGKTAPDVVLHVDHIDPVSAGGGNDIINLITSCEGCNLGKSDTKLDDQAMLAKQRAMIADLSERREQLKMLVQWRKGLKSIGEQQVEAAQDHFALCAPGFSIRSDAAVKLLKKHICEFGLAEVMAAMEIAADKYIVKKDDKPEHESVNTAWSKVGGICHNRKTPGDSDLNYIRATIRNRINYTGWDVMPTLRAVKYAGATRDQMYAQACRAYSWRQFKNWADDLIEDGAK